MTALAGYYGAVYITSSSSVSLGTFALNNPSSDGVTWTTPTAQYAKRYWDKTATWIVQTSNNGGTSWTTASAGTYSIQYVGGIVTLNSSPGGTPAVQITSGNYFPYSLVADAHQWEASIDSDVADVTTFSSGGWKTQMALMRGGSVKFSKFWVDATYLSMLGNLMIVVCFVNNTSGPQTGPRYEAYGYIKQDPVKSDVKQVVTEDVEFAIDGQLYYVAN